MYDHVKAYTLCSCINKLLKLPFINWYHPIDTVRGTPIETIWRGHFNHLTFTIYESGRVTISGSIHKFYNRENQNYNEFNIHAVNRSIEVISSVLQVKPHQIILNNLEFGVNIIPPVSSKEIISNLLLYKGDEFLNDSGKAKYMKQVKKAQYRLKAYDKAIQYDLNSELFRFEIKIKKMEKLSRLGITNLDDLTNGSKFEKLGELLALSWDEIIFFDHNMLNSDLPGLNKDWASIHFWSKKKKELINHRKKFRQEIQRFKQFQTANSRQLHEHIGMLIYEEWLKLSDTWQTE